MSVFRLALTALTLATKVARNPAARAAVGNPKLREAAIKGTKGVAYNAGRMARKVLPRNLIG